MAKRTGKDRAANAAGGEGAKVPGESALLDGEIITASKACMTGKSYERGYPIPDDYLHMDNLAGGRKK